MGQCREIDQGIIVLLNEGHGLKINYCIVARENKAGGGRDNIITEVKIITYIGIIFSFDLKLAYCSILNKQKQYVII